MVPATGKVGGSAADLQEGGLIGVVERVLDTGVIEHLGRVYGGVGEFVPEPPAV